MAPYRFPYVPRPPQTLPKASIGLIQPICMLWYTYTCLEWGTSTYKWSYVISDLAAEWPLGSTLAPEGSTMKMTPLTPKASDLNSIG